MKYATLILTVALFCNCSSSQKVLRPEVKAASDSNDPELDEIREAVFRFQFQHNGSSLQERATAYYLELRTSDGRRKTDPTDTFLKRFIGNRPPVKKRSEARVPMEEFYEQEKLQTIPFLPKMPLSYPNDYGVIDRFSGRSGIILYQYPIHRISESKADVYGGYYEGGESASGNTYTVEKQNGKWTVTFNKMHWISESKTPLDFELFATDMLVVSEPFELSTAGFSVVRMIDTRSRLAKLARFHEN